MSKNYNSRKYFTEKDKDMTMFEKLFTKEQIDTAQQELDNERLMQQRIQEKIEDEKEQTQQRLPKLTFEDELTQIIYYLETDNNDTFEERLTAGMLNLLWTRAQWANHLVHIVRVKANELNLNADEMIATVEGYYKMPREQQDELFMQAYPNVSINQAANTKRDYKKSIDKLHEKYCK